MTAWTSSCDSKVIMAGKELNITEGGPYFVWAQTPPN